MVEQRTLIREVVLIGPDYTSTKITQRCEVGIDWGDKDADSFTMKAAYAVIEGEWRLLAKEPTDAST